MFSFLVSGIWYLNSQQDGVYPLKFLVEDHVRRETAVAVVVVTVKGIPEEAVRLSGSLRLSGVTQEGFIEAPVDGTSLSRRYETDRL